MSDLAFFSLLLLFSCCMHLLLPPPHTSSCALATSTDAAEHTHTHTASHLASRGFRLSRVSPRTIAPRCHRPAPPYLPRAENVQISSHRKRAVEPKPRASLCSPRGDEPPPAPPLCTLHTVCTQPSARKARDMELEASTAAWRGSARMQHSRGSAVDAPLQHFCSGSGEHSAT